MELHCHNCSVDRFIKVKIEYGLVKVSAIPFQSRSDRFYHYIALNFTFWLLECVCYMGDIVIPWIVKPGFCSIYYIVTLAWLKNVNHYIWNIALSKTVILGFHCI